MSKQRLFFIGKTSKLFHLSVSTLRHYEALGLLQPEYIDEDSRYRYYGVRQFEVLNTIRYLRMLDLPLDKIESILQRKDLSQMELFLEEQQVLIQKKQLERIWSEVTPQQKIICIEEPVDIHQPYEIEHSLRRLDTDKATIFLERVGINSNKFMCSIEALDLAAK